MVKFSFFLPAFKAEYLDKAIRSIIEQSLREWELLIVNDASPENVDAIVSSYLADPRVKYYQNEKNLGRDNLVGFWNSYIPACSGKYIVFASDDDLYEPDYLQEMLSLTEEYPDCDLFHCRIQYINKDGNIIQIAQPAQCYETQMDFIYQRLVWKRKQTLQEFVFRKAALLKKGGLVSFPLAWTSDSATTYLMAEHGVAYTGKILFSSRASGCHISNEALYAPQKIEAMKRSGQWLLDFLPNVKCGSKEEEFMKKEALRICTAERYASYPKYLQKLSLTDFLKEMTYIAQHHIFSWRARVVFTIKRLIPWFPL